MKVKTFKVIVSSHRWGYVIAVSWWSSIARSQVHATSYWRRIALKHRGTVFLFHLFISTQLEIVYLKWLRYVMCKSRVDLDLLSLVALPFISCQALLECRPPLGELRLARLLCFCYISKDLWLCAQLWAFQLRHAFCILLVSLQNLLSLTIDWGFSLR